MQDPLDQHSRKPHGAPAPQTRGILIRWAILYDRLNRLQFFGQEDAFRKRTIELAVIEEGQRVLDVGCGTGNLTMAALVRVGAEGDARGIDGAPEMIREAERKAAAAGLDVRYEVGLIEKLPFPENYFDVVLSSLMLHHLPRDLKRQGVAEVARVLKPAGRFLAVDVDPWLLGNLRCVGEAMRYNGFTGIQSGRTGFRTMFIPIHYLAGTAGASNAEHETVRCPNRCP
jgi:demethylmenaquinone methyltransferase/2-methoxy-6-polyprenyl-1,4-benzoquinol methylase/phosphoethanolamine N-methyltransferase